MHDYKPIRAKAGPVAEKRKPYLLENINVNHGGLAAYCVPTQEIIRREHLADYFDEIPSQELIS